MNKGSLSPCTLQLGGALGPCEWPKIFSPKPLSLLCKTGVFHICHSPAFWHEYVNNLDGISLSLRTIALKVFLVIGNVSHEVLNVCPHASEQWWFLYLMVLEYFKQSLMKYRLLVVGIVFPNIVVHMVLYDWGTHKRVHESSFLHFFHLQIVKVLLLCIANFSFFFVSSYLLIL